MAALMYTAESAWLCTMVALLWPLYFSQLLVMRFTPRRRRVRIKLLMLLAGAFGVAALTGRMIDPSAVFGRIPEHANMVMAVQATTAAFFIAACWLVASARSLHQQIQQPMPRWVTPVLYGSVLLFQLVHTSLFVAQWQMLARPAQHSDWSVMVLFIPLDLALDAEAMVIFTFNWFLYLNLRKKTAAFLATLTRQESQLRRVVQRQKTQMAQLASKARVEAGAASASVAPASPSLQAQQAQQGGESGALVPQAQTPILSSDEQQTMRSSSTLTPAFHSKPSLSTGGPSALSLLAPIRAASITRSGTLTAKPAMLAAPAAAAAAATGTPVSSPPASPTLNPASPSSPPSSLASIVAITISAAGSGVASSSSSSPASTGSAAQERVRELAAALRKMTYMALLVSLVCIGAVAQAVPRLSKVFQGEIIQRDLHGADPSSWTAWRMLPVVLHVLSFFVTIWYVWLSPAVWASAAVRAQRGTPFWRTLIYGLQEQERRYEMRPPPVSVNKRANAGDLDPPSARAPSHSLMRTHTHMQRAAGSTAIGAVAPSPSPTVSPLPGTSPSALSPTSPPPASPAPAAGSVPVARTLTLAAPTAHAQSHTRAFQAKHAW